MECSQLIFKAKETKWTQDQINHLWILLNLFCFKALFIQQQLNTKQHLSLLSVITYMVMSSKTRLLVDDLKRSSQSFYDTLNISQQNLSQQLFKQRKRSPSIIKLTKQRVRAKSRYEDLTNMTKQQQKSQIWNSMQSSKINNKDWSYAYYTGNRKLKNGSETFGIYDNKYLQEFPDNNTKYNIQFLDRSLHGTSILFSHIKLDLKLPQSDAAQIKTPPNKLYSKHYKPIVKGKQQFNQDWQLSPSKFGKIPLDYKRDRIINYYQLQANPFKTQKSNSLLSKITKSQIY